jgi:hypothetical protein
MDRQTLEALQGSIKKWQGILAGAADRGGADCALCAVFNDIDSGNCRGCPADSGTDCCGGHYRAWIDHAYSHEPTVRVPITRAIHPGCPECIRLATNVRDYLKGLLPKEG